MRGSRLTHTSALLVAVAVLTVSWASLPSVADDCGPYTRSSLLADRAPTTSTSQVDLVTPAQGRGIEVDPDATEVLVDPPVMEEPAPRQDCPDFVYDMEYPLLGAGQFGSGFGAPRDGGSRLHMGVDIMAPKLTPVVAVADATVSWIRDTEDRCCYVGLTHEDGWQSWYIHLNNDSYDTDDGSGVGIRPDLEIGMELAAGELIGWVGDSGNAETTPSHLHFELHLPSGEPIDAWPSVRAAEGNGASAMVPDLSAAFENEADVLLAQVDPALSRTDFVGPFLDDDGTAVEPVFASLTAQGVSLWCDEWGIRVCPDEPATGGDAEAWIAAVTDTGRDPSVAIAYESQPTDLSLDRSVACTTAQFCPEAPVTYGETAAMLIGTTDGDSVLTPDDAMGVLADRVGLCGPRDSATGLTRAELAGVLWSWTTGAPIDCTAVS